LDLGVANRVRFHGAIPQRAVPAAIDSCHAFAFTSTTEGQCLAALEILARGRPILASSVGALPDILSEPALGSILKDMHPRCYAEALRSVVQSARKKSIDYQHTRDQYAKRVADDAILDCYERLLIHPRESTCADPAKWPSCC
jgi:glycosyltransferase involved in cell wall biosynthesis